MQVLLALCKHRHRHELRSPASSRARTGGSVGGGCEGAADVDGGLGHGQGAQGGAQELDVRHLILHELLRVRLGGRVQAGLLAAGQGARAAAGEGVVQRAAGGCARVELGLQVLLQAGCTCQSTCSSVMSAGRGHQARPRTSWSAKLRTSVSLGVLAARAVPASAARATTKICTALMVLGQLGSRLRLCGLAEGEL